MGSPYRVRGRLRLHGNDGCGRCVRGVTLTPALSRQGRGGRRQPGMGSPYRVRGRLRLHGNDGLGVVSGESPSPQPSPVKGEGAGGSRGWVPRIEYGAGSVCTGTTVWALCPGSHPHPCPLPSRERGPEAAGDGFPVSSTGQAPFARERRFGCARFSHAILIRRRPGEGGFQTRPYGAVRGGGTGQAPFARERRLWALCPGSHPHPCPLPSRERGPEAAGDGFPVSSTGQAPFARERRFGRCVRGVTLTPALSRQGRGGRRQPGMGSPYRVRGRLRLHGNDGLGVVCGESPSPQPSPVKGEGAGGGRGWVPRIEYGAGSVCTGTTVWALCPGSHPHPILLPSRERGPEAAGDGFPVSSTGQAPFARERRFGRCVRGVTLTPYRGTGQALNPLPSRERGPEAAGDGFRIEYGAWVPGESPSPLSPVDRVRGRLRLHGNDGLGVVSGESPSPQPSPVKGEGAGGRGWVPRIEYGALRLHGNDGVLCPGSHPHPSPLPSREGVTLTPYRGTGQALNPLPSRERRPEAGDGFPLKAGTTMWRTGTAVGWGRLVRRPGCPGLAG